MDEITGLAKLKSNTVVSGGVKLQSKKKVKQMKVCNWLLVINNTPTNVCYKIESNGRLCEHYCGGKCSKEEL
jgi:hypothetical protein